jgi:hypothetical protein
MKTCLAVVVVVLLAWIGISVQQSNSRESEARHDRAVRASQDIYLTCVANSKHPDTECPKPTE